MKKWTKRNKISIFLHIWLFSYRWILKVRSKPSKHPTVAQVSLNFWSKHSLTHTSKYTHAQTHTHTYIYRHTHSTYDYRLGVSVQQSNFITVSFIYYLHSLKSTASPFHYSEGNNFIKFKHGLQISEVVSVCIVWLKTSKLDMSSCKCAKHAELSWSQLGYYHAWAKKPNKKNMKSVIVGCASWWWRWNLWMRLIPVRLWGNRFSLLDHVVIAVNGWGTLAFPKSEQAEWDLFFFFRSTFADYTDTVAL